VVLPADRTGDGECTCRHSLDCNCECHGRHCDPTEHVCSIEYLPDEGGLTPWGCPVCTPGQRLAHLAGCAATGVSRVGGGTAPSPR
jgi:hypothetical protein